jgi:hypothetical protein
MSTYKFKIRNNYNFTTGGTINPMVYSAYTGTQKFTKYLSIFKNDVPPPFSPLKPLEFDSESFTDSKDEKTFRRRLGLSPAPDFTINTPFSDYVSSGGTINTAFNFKNITFPIEVNFDVTDYGDEINNFVKSEQKKAINKIVDYERVRYTSEPYPSIGLKFRFFDKDNTQYDDNNLTGGYTLAGFNEDEINKKNNFKKSYFRLYFFDSNDTMSQNLLLTEEIDVFQSKKPEFNFSRIFWLKEDELFLNGNNNRIVYMEARFFNAKTGRVHRFMNPPSSIVNPIPISNLKNNQEWKTSQILIFNPKNTNGVYKFKTVNGVGANTQNTITMTEYILET